MTSAPIEGRGCTIHQLFNGHRYQLDFYQREYTWGSENVRRLVDDLHRRFSNQWNALHDRRDSSRYKPYFLGPYVYFQDGDITYLVDGQQRVTTLHLLLILIHNLLDDQDALDEARQLETLICNVMYGERRYTIDIEERAPLLDALMAGKSYEVKPDDRPSVRNLWDRYRDLEEQFPSDLAGEALSYFHDWLLHRVCLVGIEAHDQGHGWEIFETMNDRGLQLSPVDLLKSLLLARSEQTGRRRLNEIWRKAMTGLSALGGTGAAADFVKALLVGRYANPASADDLIRIEVSFHEWIHGNLTRMALARPADFATFITDEFAPFAEAYCTLFSAAQSPDSNLGLHSLFFNNVNGIRNQFQLIFAAVRRGDSPGQIRAKAQRVADFLDLLYVRRIISGHSAHPSELDGAVTDLIPKLRNAHDLEAVTGLLSAELSSDPFDFADITTFGLGADNRRQVHYLLARLTAFVEVESGRPNRIGEYLDEQRSHQIEHIWPNHYDRYRDLVKNTAAFDRSRNRFGALLLLHRSDNASYRDEPYSAKVEYYRGSQNLLAASLHPTTHTRNPTFGRFLKRYDLASLMRPYPTGFDDKAILARQDLYRRLCEIIWDPARLGFTILTPRRVSGPAHRSRARYGVDIPQLMSAGLLKAGDTLIAVHRGTEHQAIVLDDGRIKLAGGEPFTSLSSAAAYAKRTKSANGWEFWQLQSRRERRPLKEIRDELVRGER
jgi:Protein of unknown function DUF262/Restriction Enzyme Adenine Methylase Associated/Protein of unknown function (DUF1524)